MKRKLYLLVALLISLPAFAQEGIHLGLQVTPKMPLIINQNTYGDPELEYAAAFGLAAGVEAGYHFTDHIGLFTGFQYSEQGQEYEDLSDQDEPIERNVHLTYWRIPLYIRYSSHADGVGFYANAGAYYGILNSAEIEYLIGATDQSLSEASPLFTNSDIGLLAALGAKFHFTDQVYATAGVRFTYGFSDINAEDWRIPNDDGVYEASKNTSIGLNLGLAYVIDTR